MEMSSSRAGLQTGASHHWFRLWNLLIVASGFFAHVVGQSMHCVTVVVHVSKIAVSSRYVSQDHPNKIW